MRLYKLTDADGCTGKRSLHNLCPWGEKVTHVATGSGEKLCSDGVIHAYEHPLIAVFMNPVHANYQNPLLWEAEGDVIARDGQLKCGVKSLTTIKKIPLPTITTDQLVRIAIHIALSVCKEPSFVKWANNWLKGSDRSIENSQKTIKTVYGRMQTGAVLSISNIASINTAIYSARTAAASYTDPEDVVVWSAKTAWAAPVAEASKLPHEFDLLSILIDELKIR